MDIFQQVLLLLDLSGVKREMTWLLDDYFMFFVLQKLLKTILLR